MPKNEGHEYEERIGPDAVGDTVLDYLTRKYRHSTRAEWESRIGSGRVLLDSEPSCADSRMRRGQRLVWRRPPWDEPAAPPEIATLFEDDDLLAVAKPAGLPTLPGAGFLQTTLLHQVRLRAPEAAPLHRLGRWTSGVVLFARTRGARAALSGQWASLEIGKRYRALASGEPVRQEFTVAVPIGPVPHPLLGSVHAAARDGKPASSRVTVVELRAGAFLCDVAIATGRPHQIRIHLAAAGHPLVGDPLYGEGGAPRPGARAVPGDPGYLLHSAALSFRHPRTAHRIEVECEPPPQLRSSCPDRRSR